MKVEYLLLTWSALFSAGNDDLGKVEVLHRHLVTAKSMRPVIREVTTSLPADGRVQTLTKLSSFILQKKTFKFIKEKEKAVKTFQY